MLDLRLPVQDAVVAALQPIAGTPIEGKALQLFQHVPQRKPPVEPPMAIVGDIVATAMGGKDGGIDSVAVTILSLYRGEARRHLYAIQELIRARLENQALPAQAGAEISRPTFDGADDELLDDGVTYLGTQRFTVIAQPAD